MKYQVIVENKKDSTDREIIATCEGNHGVERVMRGVYMNLNTKDWRVFIEEVEERHE